MNYQNLTPGKNPPKKVYVLIEIPKESNVKYEFDKENSFLVVDRFLHTAMNYPFNYGFIPKTLADDGDPVDVLVLSEHQVQAGTLISVNPIGVLIMEDEEGLDEKIIAVPEEKIDPVCGVYKNLKSVPRAWLMKIKHFFENYKTLEPGKWVKVKNWFGKERAEKIIQKAIENYKKNA